jgi:hypothetical protein
MSDIERILLLEREHDDFPDGAEARILGRLETAIGGGGDGPSGGGGSPSPVDPASTARAVSPWVARIATLAVGVGLGAGGHAILTSPKPEAAPVTPASAAIALAPASARGVDVDAAPALTPADLPSASAAVASASARPLAVAAVVADAGPREGSAALERADLDVARAALAHGRVQAALDRLAEHEKKYGNGGNFAEEREVLWVQTLVSAGRRGEAVERARRFRARYPSSLFGPAVEQAVDAGK